MDEKDLKREREKQAVRMRVECGQAFNFALYIHQEAPIRNIRFDNLSDTPVEGLTLSISADYEFFAPYEQPLPPLPAGREIELGAPALEIRAKKIARLNETTNTTITVSLSLDGSVIAAQKCEMKILPYDQAPGFLNMSYLAAFVMPNHPVVAGLQHDASEILRKNGRNPSLDGYQNGGPDHAIELAWAAYAAVQRLNIAYAEPPASFADGQRVRTPELVYAQRLGTCMDMTLLYAAVLEAIGLHPVLYAVENHIFCGFWLTDKCFDDVCLNENEPILKRLQPGSQELLFVECTAMCAGEPQDFDSAVISLTDGKLAKDAFRVALDIRQARNRGILPMPARSVEGSEYQIEFEERPFDELSRAPKYRNIVVTEAAPAARKPIGKRELWENKLLDLSPRNTLLNLPKNRGVERILSGGIDEIEDALSDGEEFRLLPLPAWLTDVRVEVTDRDGKPAELPWIAAAQVRQGYYELTDWQAGPYDLAARIREEYRSHRLYSFCTPGELDRSLTGLYRNARLARQENGVSNLYLAMGLLRWYDPYEQQNERTAHYAPLVLIPIEIRRQGANQGYTITRRDDDPHFNTTLLEFLRQKHEIDIPGLEPLPQDEHGVDIRQTFAIVRSALLTVPDWDVVETCAIGCFTFARFAMWNDIHTASDKLEASPIVRSLMKGYVDWKPGAKPSGEEPVYLPIPLDETQLQAVSMAAAGETFVLHGPPGTGKSQTITAMIANLIAKGKTVLFVAEKQAALNVVQRRLQALDIGGFCLELHSDKANKKQVLLQLDGALQLSGRTKPSDYAEYLQKTAGSSERLDDYARSLHRKQRCGYSLFELIGLYETVADSEYEVVFRPETARLFTKNSLREHLPLLSRLLAAGEAMNGLSGHPLKSLRLTEYSIQFRARMEKSLTRYEELIGAMVSAGAAASELLQISAPQTAADYRALAETTLPSLMELRSDPKYIVLLGTGTAELETYLARKDANDRDRNDLLRVWKPEFISASVVDYLARLDMAGKKLLGRKSAVSAIYTEIKSFARSPIYDENIPAVLTHIYDVCKETESIAAEREMLPGALRQLLETCPTRQALSEARAEAERFAERCGAQFGGMEQAISLSRLPELPELQASLRAAYADFRAAGAELGEALGRPEPNEQASPESETAFCRLVRQRLPELKELALYNQIRKECLTGGLLSAVEDYERGLPAEKLLNAYRKGVYSALIGEVIDTDPVIGGFSGATFSEAIAQFRQLDEQLQLETRSEIFNNLDRNLPVAWESPTVGTELSFLRKAISSGARGISIRMLFEKIPHVLPRIAPCMLMSPDSVAQYLPQENGLFDVVIFDEASQLQTSKSVGALYRGRSAVIVGDPKQMPPTTFFDSAMPVTDDLMLEDLDSVLDDVLALGVPSQYLRWHYRSTHESLIAFSNHQFYENRMFTFPSANDQERRVHTVFVEGEYKSGLNPKEAQAVVAEVVRRYRDPVLRGQSIGIVTFNIKQQQLIEDLLAKQYQTDHDFDIWAHTPEEDCLFVKNLENVQGDERDVIFFSVGYGPDERGRVLNNFGPILRPGGEKRLNVAFSRARVEMVIFASLHATDIRLTETSSEGLRAFHDFLRFAEGVDLPKRVQKGTGSEADTAGVTDAICETIRKAGFECRVNVGHSDFHVDIAVVDPFEPTQYLLGILLDGENYRQTRSTRDREVSQLEVLRRLGWSLLRIWTIDWWDNSEKETEKLLAALARQKSQAEADHAQRLAEQEARVAISQLEEKLLQETLAAQLTEVVSEAEAAEAEPEPAAFRAAPAPIPAEPQVLPKSEPAPPEELTQPAVELPVWSLRDYTYYTGQQQTLHPADFTAPETFTAIQTAVSGILETEAPIQKELLAAKVRKLFGVSKTQAVQDIVEKAIRSAKPKLTKEGELQFCWQIGANPADYRIARRETAAQGRRSIDEIPKQELRNAICVSLAEKDYPDPESLLRDSSRLLGFGRYTAGIAAGMERGLQFAKTSGAIVKAKDGTISLKKTANP